MSNRYLFVADFGNTEREEWIDEAMIRKDSRIGTLIFNKSTARKYFFDFVLTDEQRNATQSIELIEVQ